MNDLEKTVHELLDAEEAIDKCDNCFPDHWCFDHAVNYNTIMHRLRKMLNRQEQPKEAV
jgi:hypothetical protein